MDIQIIQSVQNMPSTFVIRFAAILFTVMAIAAFVIHFMSDRQFVVVFWIFSVPFILGVPILASVVLAKNDELDISKIQ